MIPIKPENAAKINFDPRAFFLKPFHLLISLILRTRLQNTKLQKRDAKTFWVSFVNMVSRFSPYFIFIQAHDGLHANIVHLRLLWTSMVHICNKFKHWYQKWTCSRILVLVSLSIEVLTPGKILSKTFQSEDVDSVETESLINRTKQNMHRIQKKEFEQLPTIKRFESALFKMS